MDHPVRRFPLLCAAAAWICLVGCTGSAPPPDANTGDPSPGPPVGDASGLILTQEARPTVLAPGDTLHVTLTITNPTSHDISRRFTSGCVQGFALWSADGIAAPPPPVCTMNAPLIVYAAGVTETHSWTWEWNGAEPAPGTYRLHAGLGVRGTAAAAVGVDVVLER